MYKNVKKETEEQSENKFFDLGEAFRYFFRRKGDYPKGDMNLRAMHFINKFSIVVFILGILYLIGKNIF